MKSETLKDEILVRYLLDDITDAVREQIEEHFFQDDSFFEEMLALEDELRYEYQQNRLSSKERDAFEKKFLNTPEEREKIAFTRAFTQASTELKEEIAPESSRFEKASIASWRQILSSLFSFTNPAMRYGLAATLLLLTLGASWLLWQNSQTSREIARDENNRNEEIERQNQILAEKQRQQSELEQQLAAEKQQREKNELLIQETQKQLEKEITEVRKRANQNLPNSVSPTPSELRQNTVFAISLLPGSFNRSEGKSGKRINLSTSIKTLRISLLLDNKNEYANYRATLSNVDEGEIWNGPIGKTQGKTAKRSVLFNVPATVLKRGDYELTLSGTNTSNETEEIHTYYFSVLR